MFIVGGYLLLVGLLVFHCYGYFTSSSGGSSGDSFIDSFYMTVVTTFTVGYGDIFPHSFGTKMLCDALVLAGHWVPIIFSSWLRSIVHRLDQRFLSTVERQSLRRFYHLCFAICAILVSIFSGVAGFYIFERDRILGFSHGSPSPSPSPPSPSPCPCPCPSPSPSPSPSLLRFSDVFHLSVMTVTTAGYGDISFVTPGGRAFATIWIPISVTLFASGMTFLTQFLLDCCRGRHRGHHRSVIGIPFLIAYNKSYISHSLIELASTCLY